MLEVAERPEPLPAVRPTAVPAPAMAPPPTRAAAARRLEDLWTPFDLIFWGLTAAALGFILVSFIGIIAVVYAMSYGMGR